MTEEQVRALAAADERFVALFADEVCTASTGGPVSDEEPVNAPDVWVSLRRALARYEAGDGP